MKWVLIFVILSGSEKGVHTIEHIVTEDQASCENLILNIGPITTGRGVAMLCEPLYTPKKDCL